MKKAFYSGVICLVVGLAVGFLGGRAFWNEKETVKYVRGEAVRGTVGALEPVKIEIPNVQELPLRSDTVYMDKIRYIHSVVDTAAIILDYELKRSYVVPLFDNQYGKLDVSMSTQYNRISDLSYNYIPIQKVITRERLWIPFLSASYSTLNYAAVGGGMFYRDWGVQLQYVTDWKRNGFSVGLMRKF
jgi:hypothetical protein